MRPIQEMPASVARGIVGVLTDIDGTLTIEGKLTAEAYLALWRLKAAGLYVVPVTGRPAGWCDLIARQWPVDAVVGENGALLYYEVGRALRRLYHPQVAAKELRARLEAVRDDILAVVPDSRVAKDQAFRMFDLAIDFREEDPDLGLEGAEAIRAVFERHGAQAKISDIHVNGWFGSYDKLGMVKLAAREIWDIDLEADRERFVFCGDSPNDEPMFEFFPHACGVANVRAFAGRMRHLPRWIAAREAAGGFAEMTDVLLERRGT